MTTYYVGTGGDQSRSELEQEKRATPSAEKTTEEYETARAGTRTGNEALAALLLACRRRHLEQKEGLPLLRTKGTHTNTRAHTIVLTKPVLMAGAEWNRRRPWRAETSCARDGQYEGGNSNREGGASRGG